MSWPTVLRKYPRAPSTPVLPSDFDRHAYDDILQTVTRQGFIDCLGDDLIPARYDNGAYTVLDGWSAVNSRLFRPKTRRQRFTVAAAQHQAAYEQWLRNRQLERERISDVEWKREETRRDAVQEELWRRIEQGHDEEARQRRIEAQRKRLNIIRRRYYAEFH
jgi:hypothetical protein